ncbi:MAG: dihydroorotase [Chitinophagaceae bacterium]
MAFLLREVIVMDPNSSHHGKTVDILLEDGLIKEIGTKLHSDAAVFQGRESGETLMLSPGFVDLFADYREPGFEQKETILTGLATAANGGFTDVFLLPNTLPVNDGRSGIEYALQKSRGQTVQLHPLGAISQKIEGKSLAEMMDMRAHGAIAFTDGWKSIQSSGLMLKALEYVKAFNGIVIHMPMDDSLAAGGLMHEGTNSTKLGMPGIPSLAESNMVQRDIELCKYTQSRLHLTGISCKESVALIRQAKAEGVAVSCSVTPYHLLLNDDVLSTYDSLYKVSPPLRTEEDRKALIAGLADGTIECIASHHRPQDWDAKAKEFEYAGEGMAIQDIVLPLVIKAVGNAVSLERIIDALSIAPRRIFGLPSVSIQKNADVRFTLFAPDAAFTFSKESSPSLSRNNPFEGMALKGSVEAIFTNKN